MIELLKLALNGLLLRESMRKGEMTAGVWVAALLFLAVVAGIGVPTILYYDRHPDASAQILLEAAAALGVVLIIYFWLAIRWRLSLKRERQEIK